MEKIKEVDNIDSILNCVKKSLGIDPSDDSFDSDIMLNINTVIFSLSQMGVGSPTGYSISSIDDKWDDYIGASTINLEAVKTYLYLKTKLTFDPPTNSTVIDSINKTLTELEWRMMLAVETNNLEV